MELPTSLAAWAGLIFAVLSILALLIGTVVKLAKQHIASRINSELKSTIRTAILDGLKPVEIRMNNMQLQLVTQDGELARVRRIEEQLENGLTKEVCRQGEVLNDIQRHLMWSGEDRREGGTNGDT